MKAAAKKFKTIEVDGKQRYYEPAPKGISAANFKKVVESRRSVRKFTDKPIPKEVLDECLQLHGGYGFMQEYAVAEMWTDARVQRIYGGTNEIMKELIARGL